jgi:anaerobic selenocysteine-containing dehydrogenase
MAQLGTGLANASDPRIEMVFIYNCNPVATAPDQATVIAELSREDRFVVVHEQVMTDTAKLADVVLPATAFLEHRELRRGYGVMRMFDSPPVAKPPGEARSNTQVFGALLEKLRLVKPGDAMTDEELVAKTFAGSPHGAELRTELQFRGIAFPPEGARPLPFVDAFPDTPDGKIHFVPTALDAEAPGGLYAYRDDPATTEYPLALISPALATQISSMFGQLRKAPATLEMSPADATARELRDGDRVRVFNAQGEVHCRVRISPDIRAGVCVLPKGLWRKHTDNGFTANVLVPPTVADLGGQAAYNDARVEVAKR